MKDKYSRYQLKGLILFQLVFAGISMWQSPNAAYYMADTKLFGLRTDLIEYISPVFPMLFIQILILIILEYFLFWLGKKVGLNIADILLPLFILLTISIVFQDYMHTNLNAMRHYLNLLVGIMVMIVVAVIAKHSSDIRSSRQRNVLLIMTLAGIYILSLLLLGWRVVGKTTFGSYHVINIFGLSFMPVEWLKIFTVLFTGVAYIPMRMNRQVKVFANVTVRIKTLFYIGMVLSISAVTVSNDFGNLIILMCLYGIVLFVLNDNRLLLRLILAGILLFSIVYYLGNNGIAFQTAAFRINSVFSIATDATYDDSTKRAFLACVKAGLFGSGTGEKAFVDNIFAVYTDYCFIAIQTIWGIFISLLVILSYAMLCMSFYRPLKAAEQKSAISIYSNLMPSVLAVQMIIHISVNLSILPFTGVVLPFISSGLTGTLYCFTCLGMAIGVNMDDDAYQNVVRILKNFVKRN